MKIRISTTNQQSDRLVKCGVSTDTADMFRLGNGKADIVTACTPYHAFVKQKICDYVERGEIVTADNLHCRPVWSLSALLMLLPPKIDSGCFLAIQKIDAQGRYGIAYMKTNEYGDVVKDMKKAFVDISPIETCIQMIDWLISNKYELNNKNNNNNE